MLPDLPDPSDVTAVPTYVPWTQVASSNVVAVRYIGTTLSVRFQKGATYDYFDVPYYVVREMLNSPSKGRFVHHHLKGVYRYEGPYYGEGW